MISSESHDSAPRARGQGGPDEPADRHPCPHAEQLSGTPFTAPRGQNERTWCYRIRPSVRHTGRFAPIEVPHWKSAPHIVDGVVSLGQFRWDPLPMPAVPETFLTGMRTMTTAGDVNSQVGMAIHAYVANADMVDEYFYSADSELLLVPQVGRLDIFTELGRIALEPLEIAIIPRGLVFRVALPDGEARGFVCENYGQKFTLPERGPIGANCLANSRDFKTPVAAFEDRDTPSRLMVTTPPASTTCAAIPRSARSSSTIPTRRSSPCSARRRAFPAPRTSTS